VERLLENGWGESEVHLSIKAVERELRRRCEALLTARISEDP
jgi:hypothetical protein